MARNKDSKTNIWLPLFLMIGCIVGLILAVSMDDYAYLAGGVAGGLLLGILIWATAIEVKKKKK